MFVEVLQRFFFVLLADQGLKTANPVVADRVRERSCVCSSLLEAVLGWAGFLFETLEA